VFTIRKNFRRLIVSELSFICSFGLIIEDKPDSRTGKTLAIPDMFSIPMNAIEWQRFAGRRCMSFKSFID
jgi:hypothetical protein